MQKQITVVMYHFVRDLKHSKYPKIKGLSIDNFKGQLSYLERYYNFVTIEDCLDAVYCNKSLPDKAALLTFDDAYIDHYLTVFPLLDKKNIQGCFFPPAKAITNNEVLDVNKIHFILATAPDVETLVKDIYEILDQLRSDNNNYNLESNQYYFDKLAVASRFDVKEVVFIKRLLQSELNKEVSSTITDYLFKKYVTENEKAFSRELYMNIDHLKHMNSNGMYIGGHGYDHFWLNTLPPEKQKIEIQETVKFLSSINTSTDKWVMCYPYGAYNQSLIDILKSFNCGLAFTTHVGIAMLTAKDAYTLPRLDTNDFPKDANISSNDWNR